MRDSSKGSQIEFLGSAGDGANIFREGTAAKSEAEKDRREECSARRQEKQILVNRREMH